MKNTKVNLNYTELTAVKHNSNLQAFESFKKRAGLRPSAPWEAVLEMFIEWKNECERIAGKSQDSETYMQSVNEAIEEARAIFEN